METQITTDRTSLGANYNPQTKSVDFKLYSKNATKVFLCIFEKPYRQEPIMTLEMQKGADNVWETSVKDYMLDCKNKPVFYGYRIFGSNWEYSEDYKPSTDIGFKSCIDENLNRFNPNKIAYDPFSRELSHLQSDVVDQSVFRCADYNYMKDNSRWAIKSVYVYNKDKEIAKVSSRPFAKEVIGEVHLKDLTQNIITLEKGSYIAAGDFAKNVKNLGITMIEFLPLNEFDDKQNGGNHWGYMPLGYFSLARKYSFDKAYGKTLEEFRFMVDEFHKNDIKVCMDMVYNHTGEAGIINNNVNDTNLLSYSLIDNPTYYKVYENGYYRSNSGCGNDFNVASEGALNLIVESLVFWVNQGVDAFRFDLCAALLENSCDCSEIYDNYNSLAARLKELLKERNINVVDNFNESQDGIVLIAEPWTCGGSQCYQLGNFPDFWAEWNDVSRDIIRKITLRPNEITPWMMKEVIEGTPEKFFNINRAVNYIASHDGFSLYDLNAYKTKNPSTRGGSDWEISGDYDNNFDLRENGIKKQLAFLFLSYGIPMVQIGDVIMHSKNGNNNSYDRDDRINHLNWQKALSAGTFENRIMEYIRNLIEFRKQNPIFSSCDFISSLEYYYDNGEIAKIENRGYWDNNKDVFFGFMINAQNRIYVATSKSNDRLTCKLPQNLEDKAWYRCIDTSVKNKIDFNMCDYVEQNYVLNPQSLAIFTEK